MRRRSGDRGHAVDADGGAPGGRLSYYCCGVRIDALALEEAAEAIVSAAKASASMAVHLCNAYTLVRARQDPSLKDGLNADGLNLADGMPLVWLARRLGITSMTRRVYGPDLMVEVLNKGRRLGLRHYFYGSTPEVLDRLTDRLASGPDGVQIAGSEAPPFRPPTDQEVEESVRRMHAAGADVVWIGLGTPKQDEFVHRFADRIGLPTVAVGAAFDFLAGSVAQAPSLVQNLGLEWAYRLLREPRRLWRRYVFGNPAFVQGVVSEGTMLEWRPSGAEEETAREPPRVTVLMASFNRRRQTLRCLESLLRPGGQARLRVVLVDDGSSDGTAEAVASAYPEVTVVAGGGDLYWAGGMRLAAEHADETPFDYLLWLNDDVSIAEGAVDALVTTERRLRSARGPAIVAGALRDPATGLVSYSGVHRGRVKRTAFHRVPPGRFPRRAETMNGNVVLLSRETVERLGNLDDAFRHAIADYDYGLRAGAAGVEVWVAPGFVGECSRNGQPSNGGRMRERWRTATAPKRLPPGDWLVFTRRHAGPLWPLFWASPYVRAVCGWQR